MFKFAKNFAVKAVLISAAFLFSCSSESNDNNNEGEGASSNSQEEPADKKTNVVSKWGELKVCGNSICGSKTGTTSVQVRGVSFGWSNYLRDDEGGSASFYKETMVNALADKWKATVVRAALGIDGSNGSYLYSPTPNKERIKAVVDAAIKNDIYVIIDWHDHNANDRKNRANAFFKEMAEKYGQYDNVIFEIWNEPENDNWSTVIKPYADDIIKTIRDAGSDNLILVGTRDNAKLPDEAALNKVTDPSSNSAYVFHFYADSHKLNEQNWQASKTFKATIEAARANGAAIFVSEFGTTHFDGGDPSKGHANTHNPTSTDTWLDYLDQNNISWCAWWLNHKPEASAMFIDTFDNAKIEAATEDDLSNRANLKPSGQYIFDRLNLPKYQN